MGYKELLERKNQFNSPEEVYDWIDDAVKVIIDLVERLEKSEKERDCVIKQLKIAADENGGCWRCKWIDEITEKCTNPEGMKCNSNTNNMWEFRGLSEESNGK